VTDAPGRPVAGLLSFGALRTPPMGARSTDAGSYPDQEQPCPVTGTVTTSEGNGAQPLWP
jgi:hypothetical protein